MSIFIDRNTRLVVQGITGREGAFHTRQMLDSTGNTHRYIKVRRDNFSSLSHLIIIGHITGIHRCTRSTHRRLEFCCQRINNPEIFCTPHTTPTRYHNIRGS